MRKKILVLCLALSVLFLLLGVSSVRKQEHPGGNAVAQQPVLSPINTVYDAVTVVANGNYLYLAACPTGQSQLGSAYVFASPLSAGGASSVLNTTSLYGSPAGLAIAGNQVLVAVHPEPGGSFAPGIQPMTGIYSIPITGGPATPLWEGAPLVKPNRLAVVGSTLYIADMDGGPNASGAIFSMPVTGGMPTVVTSGPPLEDPAGIVAASNGLWICDRGTTAPNAQHSDPGTPGMLFFLPFSNMSTPVLAASGGLLKNPLDVELVGQTLYIADEGSQAGSPQGVYQVSIAGWQPGTDLTSQIAVLYSGSPLVEPIGLSALNGTLYIADDTVSQTYAVSVPSPSEASPTEPTPTLARLARRWGLFGLAALMLAPALILLRKQDRRPEQ
jgi:hypothetical protein